MHVNCTADWQADTMITMNFWANHCDVFGFGIQVPGMVTSRSIYVSITTDSKQPPAHYTSKAKYEDYPRFRNIPDYDLDTSLIYIEVKPEPGTNHSYTVEFEFVWKSPAKQISYSRYWLILPFSPYSDMKVVDRNLHGNHTSWSFLEAVNASVDLYLPNPILITEIHPEPNTSDLKGGKPYYSWDIHSLGKVLRYSPIWINLESPDATNRRELFVFCSGLLLGTGLPAIISGIIESRRKKSDECPFARLLRRLNHN